MATKPAAAKPVKPVGVKREPIYDSEPLPPPAPPTQLPALRPEPHLLLLEPAAPIDKLVASFKGYIELKEKLLESDDYTWTVSWSMGQDKTERKWFKHKDQAEKYYKAMVKKGIAAELEKKIKKSGCLKLGKAFCVSDYPVEEQLDRVIGYAYYRVRAEAPNGQFKERSGTCDRKEKGKADAPFDTIMATALTRASDRAIMALLGGETTAEEFEGGDDQGEAAEGKPPAAAPPPPPAITPPAQGAGVKPPQTPAKPPTGPPPTPKPEEGVKPPPAAPKAPPPPPPAATPAKPAPAVNAGIPGKPEAAPSTALPPKTTHEENLAALDAKFSGAKPAKPESERSRLNKRLWVALGKMYGNESKDRIHKAIKRKYNKGSTLDLTDAEFKEITEAVEKLLAEQGKK